MININIGDKKQIHKHTRYANLVINNIIKGVKMYRKTDLVKETIA